MNELKQIRGSDYSLLKIGTTVVDNDGYIGNIVKFTSSVACIVKYSNDEAEKSIFELKIFT